MNPVVRNFLNVIRRYKMTVFLNILGLSVAFAAFMVIMMQLDYDFSFDKSHKDYDRIFRLEYVRDASAQANMCRPLADRFIKSSPHILVGSGTALIALIAGAIAGAYPAHYMTSFPPAIALTGSFGLSPKGKMMRNTLTCIQLTASFTLIIGASFIYLQNYFMQNSPLGYDKDELITVDIRWIYDSRDVFINQLKQNASIDDITYSESLLSSSDQYMGWGLRYKGEGIQFQSIPVHYSFLKVMGIEITEGRDFREAYYDLRNIEN